MDTIQLAFFFMFSLVLPFLAQAQWCPTCGLQTPVSVNSSMQLANEIQKKALTSDISATCKDMLKQDTKSSSAGSGYKVGMGNEWSLSRVPQEGARKAVFDEMQSAGVWGLNNQKDVEFFLDGKLPMGRLTNDSLYPQRSTGEQTLALLVKEGQGTVKYGGALSNKSLVAAIKLAPVSAEVDCARLNLVHSFGCARGFIQIKKWMGVGNINLPEVMDKAFRDPTFEAGITLAAKKMMAEANSGHPGSHHLYDDLFESFSKAGLPPGKAKQDAWDAIGILSTGGANLGAQMASLRSPNYSDKTLVSLLAISNTLPLLDYQSHKHGGEMYSYPPGMKFTCDNAKPYHFLMSAYFTQRLIHDEGLSPTDAAMASFTAGKGYQALANIAGRDNTNVFKESVFGLHNNLTRLDLTYEAAGALYGEDGKIHNIDKGFNKMVNDADTTSAPDPSLKWQGVDLPEAYMKFYSVIHPNTVFNYFENQ